MKKVKLRAGAPPHGMFAYVQPPPTHAYGTAPEIQTVYI